MFDASIILWLVGWLGVSCISWNVGVLVYCYRARQLNTQLTEERPLKRWILKALIWLVSAELVGIVALTAAQLIRNYFLVGVAADEVPDWLFIVVAVQNLLFYGIATLPGVVLFVYTWALKTLSESREEALNKSAREYLGIESRVARRLRESREES